MSETFAAPTAHGPRWQRKALVILAVLGVLAVFLTPAGVPATTIAVLLLALAGALSLSAPGNRRYKVVVFGVLGAVLVLALVSFAWA
jgi:hypothetical protein